MNIRHYSSIALVDLSYLFTRNYRGAGVNAPPNAGAERTLQDLRNIRDDVDHVVICLDAPPYLRRDKFPAYKAHREAPPAEELTQKRAVIAEIKRLGYNVARAKGYEADDIIATLARSYGEWCLEVRMVASDKDIAQCITKNVVQYVPSHGTREAERRDHLKCKVKFGVYPAEMPLWQAMAGDSSDGIPGVKGVGAERAKEIITALNYANKPATIPGLAEYLGEAQPKGGKWTAIANNWENLKLSLELVTLDTSAPIDPESLLLKLEPEEPQGEERPGVELEDYVSNSTPAPALTQTDVDPDPTNGQGWTVGDEADRWLADRGIPPKPSAVQEQVNAAALEAHQRAADAATARVQSSPANDAGTAPAARPAVTEAEFDPISPPPGKAKAELPPLPPKPEAPKVEPPKVEAPAPAPKPAEPKPQPTTAALAKRAEQQIEWGIVNARLQPTDLRSAWTLAKWYVTSGLFSSKFQADDRNIAIAKVFAIIHRGVELGLDVGSALSGFHMIDGKPSMSADLIRTLAKRHPDCEYFYCESSDETQATWVTRNRRHPEGVIQRLTYTIEEARQVPSLWKRDRWGGPSMWEKYPKPMLSKTASTMLSRQEWESTMVGFYCPEELGNGHDVASEVAA